VPDFLTRRNNTWHFVRRVPVEFAHFDQRGVIKHSTRIKIANDRAGRRAARVADRLNAELELFWKGLSEGKTKDQLTNYDNARRRARALGFDYVENELLLHQQPEARLERLETLVAKGLVNDAGARAALLGTEKRPAFMLSKLFDEYEAATKDEVKDLTPDQLRIWRNGRKRAVERFVEIVGDKPVNEITPDDTIDYCEWWRERVIDDEVEAKTANKDIGQLSRMLKEMNVRRRLNLPDLFKGLRLKGETERPRVPYDTEFIQNRLLANGALAGLNEDARLVLYIVADSGLRPSEVVNLQENAILLGAKIPYVKILPEGRRLKTEDSQREIPLVGAAFAAMKQRPKGFPRYRDKASGLSSTLNKYLLENGLRPTKDHTAAVAAANRIVSIEV
jgi:integrase